MCKSLVSCQFLWYLCSVQTPLWRLHLQLFTGFRNRRYHKAGCCASWSGRTAPFPCRLSRSGMWHVRVATLCSAWTVPRRRSAPPWSLAFQTQIVFISLSSLSLILFCHFYKSALGISHSDTGLLNEVSAVCFPWCEVGSLEGVDFTEDGQFEHLFPSVPLRRPRTST